MAQLTQASPKMINKKAYARHRKYKMSLTAAASDAMGNTTANFHMDFQKRYLTIRRLPENGHTQVSAHEKDRDDMDISQNTAEVSLTSLALKSALAGGRARCKRVLSRVAATSGPALFQNA